MDKEKGKTDKTGMQSYLTTLDPLWVYQLSATFVIVLAKSLKHNFNIFKNNKKGKNISNSQYGNPFSYNFVLYNSLNDEV